MELAQYGIDVMKTRNTFHSLRATVDNKRPNKKARFLAGFFIGA